MKSLSSKSILDRVKRIEKKYTKTSQDINKHLEDELKSEEHSLDLNDGKGYITGAKKSLWKNKPISKNLNAGFERKTAKQKSREADIQTSQSVTKLLGMSESHSKIGNSYSSDDSEIMLKHFENTDTQNLNNPYFLKTQSNYPCNISSNLMPHSSLISSQGISTVRHHDQDNKFQFHDAKISEIVSVNRPQMKLNLKLQEVNDEEMQTASERSETSHSNSLYNMHLNIFPFESLLSGNSLQLNNEEEVNLQINKEDLLLNNAADVHSSPEKSSVSLAEESLPASSSLKTPSKYSVGENSVGDVEEDNFQSLNLNLLSIGDLLNDIQSEPDIKEKEQSNEISESLPLESEYNVKPLALDEVVNEDRTFRTNKTSVISSLMNPVVNDRSDNFSTNEEINEDICCSCASSSLTAAQVASDGFQNDAKPLPDFQLIIAGGVDERQTCHSQVRMFCINENPTTESCINQAKGPQVMHNLTLSEKPAKNSNDDTTINDDIVEEIDHTDDASSMYSINSNEIPVSKNEKRACVKYNKLNPVESLNSKFEMRESVSKPQSVEKESDFVIQNISHKSNEYVNLESLESVAQGKKKKKLHVSVSKFTKSPLIKETSHHVSCQTDLLLFNETTEFDKKIEEILKSSLPMHPNLATNAENKGPKYVDVEETSPGFSNPLERGFHWALNQQVELTKHFIQSEYNMYAICMSAIREMSRNYKPLSVHTHKKKKK